MNPTLNFDTLLSPSANPSSFPLLKNWTWEPGDIEIRLVSGGTQQALFLITLVPLAVAPVPFQVPS
jgi:hypothetical protein